MTNRTAKVFAALGDPAALEVATALLERAEGSTVTELKKLTGLSQPKVTRTLKALVEAGIAIRDPVTRAGQVANAEALRRLIEGAAELGLQSIEREAATTAALQRRVRKSRLAGAGHSHPGDATDVR